jgi:hypothetical protein
MQNSEKVCDSILVIMMNMYSPQCPSLMDNVENSLSKAMSRLESHPNHTSALGEIFHNSFPLTSTYLPRKSLFLTALR